MDEDFEFDDNSSLLWLTIQQGYTKEELNAAIRGEYEDSVFLQSVHEEVINATTHINALTFFINTTFGDLLKYAKEKTDIVISKDTHCGLVDHWTGAGGLLDIQLEKDIIVPKYFIDSFDIDGARGGYGVESIFGLCSDFWNGTATLTT